MKNIVKKPTLILVIAIIIIIIGIPSGIYGLTLNGGASLGGVLILIGVFITFLILLLDRFFVSFVNYKKLNFFEFLFLIITVTLYSYFNRNITIELTNPDAEFLIVIENNGSLKNSKIEYSFPFNKKIKTNKNYIISKNVTNDVDIIPPKKWNNSYYYNIYNYKKYPKVVLFANTESKMDSIKILRYIEKNID